MMTLNGKMTLTGMMTMTGIMTMTGMIHIILANIVQCALIFGNRSGVHRGLNGLSAINPVEGDGKKDIADVVYGPACTANIGTIRSI